jgi:hypothetical protein
MLCPPAARSGQLHCKPHPQSLPCPSGQNKKVRCLNEDAPGACRAVFRAWDERTAPPAPAPLRSDPDDSELLLTIPFDGAVKLRALCIIGGAGGRAPAGVRLYANRDDLDFGAVAAMAPLQAFELQEDNATGAIEYPVLLSLWVLRLLLLLLMCCVFGVFCCGVVCCSVFTDSLHTAASTPLNLKKGPPSLATCTR